MWCTNMSHQQAPTDSEHSSKDNHWQWRQRTHHPSFEITALVASPREDQIQDSGPGLQGSLIIAHKYYHKVREFLGLLFFVLPSGKCALKSSIGLHLKMWEMWGHDLVCLDTTRSLWKNIVKRLDLWLDWQRREWSLLGEKRGRRMADA